MLTHISILLILAGTMVRSIWGEKGFIELREGETKSEFQILQSAIDGFLKYLLFTEEAELNAPVNGTSAFAKEFAAAGPRDSKGRSLRDFDLRTRMFKYPCSYLIYSKAFDELPGPLKETIYKRLFEILNGKDKEFESIQPQIRLAILEILRETKTNLPKYWQKSG